MVIMGHIIGPFGVLGWIKVATYTETIDGLLKYPTWWLRETDNDWQETTLSNGYVNGDILTVKLGQCANRNEAMQLKGMQIAIPRDRLPPLSDNGEDGYYWIDLIGATVVNLQNEELGKVIGMLETGANDVLRVQETAEKERLIPYIDPVIIKVDLALRRITVDWGMDY
jgi:16S rRNA processing protein RimM